MTDEMPEDPFDFEPVEITSDMLRRRVMWDIVPNQLIPQALKESGLHAASEEVETRELMEAAARRARVSHLDPIVNVLVGHSVEAIRAGMLVAQGPEVLENQFYDPQRLGLLIFSGVEGVLAELYDLKAIGFPIVTTPVESTPA